MCVSKQASKKTRAECGLWTQNISLPVLTIILFLLTATVWWDRRPHHLLCCCWLCCYCGSRMQIDAHISLICLAGYRNYKLMYPPQRNTMLCHDGRKCCKQEDCITACWVLIFELYIGPSTGHTTHFSFTGSNLRFRDNFNKTPCWTVINACGPV